MCFQTIKLDEVLNVEYGTKQGTIGSAVLSKLLLSCQYNISQAIIFELSNISSLEAKIFSFHISNFDLISVKEDI